MGRLGRMGRMGWLGRMGRIGPLHNCPNGALRQHTGHQLLEEGEPKILIRLIRWILCPQNRSYYTKRQYWILCPRTKTYRILCPHPFGYRGFANPLYPNKSFYTKTQYWILCPQTKILWPRGHYDLTASPTVKMLRFQQSGRFVNIQNLAWNQPHLSDK